MAFVANNNIGLYLGCCSFAALIIITVFFFYLLLRSKAALWITRQSKKKVKKHIDQKKFANKNKTIIDIFYTLKLVIPGTVGIPGSCAILLYHCSIKINKTFTKYSTISFLCDLCVKLWVTNIKIWNRRKYDESLKNFWQLQKDKGRRIKTKGKNISPIKYN